ncbi:MAG: hypothetical protein JW814_03855 [Candidatus Krumholzibacteriota bacterium]|nr:hypothetical protein [Candidatus Krumholzibacteriota bacterium]
MEEENKGSQPFPVSVDGWFSSGMNILKTRTGTLLSGMAVIILYSLFLLMLGRIPSGETIGIIIQLSFGLILTAGWLNFCLRLVRGEEDIRTADIFRVFSDFQPVWLLSISLSLLIALGTFLFVIPGIFAILRLGMSIFIVVDKKLPMADSFRFSIAMTRGHEGKLLIYYGILLGLYGLAVFPYLINMPSLGLFTSSIFNFLITPVLGVTYASAYDSLLYIYEEERSTR